MRKNTNLRGIKQERGVALYLKNIAVTDESNDEIGELVKDYARNKGIRIMGHHVIRFKTYTDTVGCKIFVPVSQQQQALNPDMWPSDITCRRWERPDVWIEQSRREQKRRYDERMMEEYRERDVDRDYYRNHGDDRGAYGHYDEYGRSR
jgi:hypothetical protein